METKYVPFQSQVNKLPRLIDVSSIYLVSSNDLIDSLQIYTR